MVPGTRKRPDAFISDFNTDFNMDMIYTEHFTERVQIHRGFFERYKMLRKEIMKVVDKFGHTVSKNHKWICLIIKNSLSLRYLNLTKGLISSHF